MKVAYFFSGKKDTEGDSASSAINPVLSEDGGVERRAVILIALAGLIGGIAASIYKLLRIPGAFDVFNYGSSRDKFLLLKSAATGEPLPHALNKKIQEEKGARAKYNRFEQRLEVIRIRSNKFKITEDQLLSKDFKEESANNYLNKLRFYLETIFNDYKIKKNIPADVLAKKISEFKEKRVFALICCCCGLPDDKGFNYIAYRVLTKGFSSLEGVGKEQADYYLKVVNNIIFLREDWYNNFFDASKTNPRKNEALQLIWNFLNANNLPRDLIKNREYYEEALI